MKPKLLILPKPQAVPRVETGPLQFEEDWPGVFIRGDNALVDAMTLESVIAVLPDEMWMQKAMLMGLMETLRSCHISAHLEKPKD